MAADGIHDSQIHDRFRHVLERVAGTRALLDKVDDDERLLACCRAVGTLPDDCRRAFLLRKVYGLSQQQVAQALQLPAMAVEELIAGGLLRYRAELLRMQRERELPAGRERA